MTIGGFGPLFAAPGGATPALAGLRVLRTCRKPGCVEVRGRRSCCSLQRIVLLANGRESLENPDFDPAPVVKLFTPDAGATWLLTEIDPDDHDHAFGLCDLGLGMPEIGWVSLGELATVRGGLGLPIERDLSFRAEKRLSAYARDARHAGRIIV